MNSPLSKVRRQRAITAYQPLAKKEADAAEALDYANRAVDEFTDEQFAEYVTAILTRHQALEGTWAYEAFRKAVGTWEASLVNRRR